MFLSMIIIQCEHPFADRILILLIFCLIIMFSGIFNDSILITIIYTENIFHNFRNFFTEVIDILMIILYNGFERCDD